MCRTLRKLVDPFPFPAGPLPGRHYLPYNSKAGCAPTFDDLTPVGTILLICCPILHLVEPVAPKGRNDYQEVENLFFKKWGMSFGGVHAGPCGRALREVVGLVDTKAQNPIFAPPSANYYWDFAF